MRMNWFKVYNEARNDAKLRTLSDAQFRVWFNLLCLASEQLDRGAIFDYDLDLLAIEVSNGDGDLLGATLAQLQRLRIITNDGEAITFCHFMDRQYDKPSDQPAAVRERVAKHRATSNKEDVTPSNAMKRPVTHREEEIREEENREEKKEKPRAKAARSFPPDFVISDEMKIWAKKNVPDLDILVATEQWSDAMRSNTTKYKYTDWEAAWRTGMKRALEWGHGGTNGYKTNGRLGGSEQSGPRQLEVPKAAGPGKSFGRPLETMGHKAG